MHLKQVSNNKVHLSAVARSRRTAIALMVAVATLMGCAPVHAQDQRWPTKGIRIVVPYGAGGGLDRSARLLAQRLSSVFNQTVIVENKPGGNTKIAAEFVAKSEADGHTLLLVAPAILTVNPNLYPSMSYKVEDLAPISMIGRIPLFVITAAEGGAKSFTELLDKGRKEGLNYGSAGTGAMTHLGVEFIKLQTNTRMTHIPYKGTASMLPDVVSGRVDFALSDMAPIKGLLDGGRLKILGSAAASSSGLYPSAPGMMDLGVKGVDVATWVGVAAPSGTRAEVQNRLSNEINTLLADSAFQKELLAAGVETTPMTQAAFKQMVIDERAKWGIVIKTGNIVGE